MLENIPKFKSNKFQCPHCQTISQQDWFDETTASSRANNIIKHLFYNHRQHIADYQQKSITDFLEVISAEFAGGLRSCIPSRFAVATCLACDDISLWIDKEMVFPKRLSAAPPNDDLSDEIKSLYLEAAKIYVDSPKGATAILRLALQKLLMQIGKEGKNINNDIKELVASGLSVKIQQALDLLRVVGNHAVHPGQINLDDNSEIALKLFQILNLIANELISKPKEIESLYNDIVPSVTIEHINQRDGKK